MLGIPEPEKTAYCPHVSSFLPKSSSSDVTVHRSSLIGCVETFFLISDRQTSTNCFSVLLVRGVWASFDLSRANLIAFILECCLSEYIIFQSGNLEYEEKAYEASSKFERSPENTLLIVPLY
jgi:hypothetical protein